MEPIIPALNVLPEPISIGSLLMKPAGTLAQTGQALSGRAEFSTGVQVIAQKIKSFSGTANIAFIRMYGEFQSGQHPVHCF